MEERSDPRVPPPLERVRGAGFDGGAFRRIPLLPIVAVVTFFLGLLMGFGLAPTAPAESTPAAAPTPGRTSTATPARSDAYPTSAPTPNSPSPSVLLWTEPPVEATPPSGGVTLARAIAIVKAQFSLKDAQILGAYLVDDRGTYSDKPPNRWVWEVVFRACTPEQQPSPPKSDVCIEGAYRVVDVDYFTGQILQ